MTIILAPQREQRPRQRQALLKLAKRPARSDSPSHLPRSSIKEAPSLFQPRFDSIAYALGRSEAHVDHLARVARSGAELDPVKVVAFANEWYLVDGHHRMEAYKAAGWDKPIPVDVRQSSLKGEERISWAIQESVRENKKNRLAMSAADKADAAWASVAAGDDLSIKDTAILHEVSQRTVASMRNVRKALQDAHFTLHLATGWRRAKSEARRLANGDEQNPSDFDPDNRKRRELAKRLKGAMELRLPARLMAEVLESYEPGLVMMMGVALAAAREEEEEAELGDI